MTKPLGLSDKEARRILQRAAEIDRTAADVVSIDTLRAAAREAGIAESSFEAALREEAERSAPSPTRRFTRRRLIAAGVALVFVLFGMFMRRAVPPERAEARPTTPVPTTPVPTTPVPTTPTPAPVSPR